MQSPLKPNAKLDNLVVQEFSDEILIYNLENHKAYSLNQTSKLVWQNCDGEKNISQIADEMVKELKQEVPEDLIWLALDKLKKDGLIEINNEMTKAFTDFNRREVIKRVGLSTMIALPLVASIVAPTAVHAQSAAACTDCVTGLGTDSMGDPTGTCLVSCQNLICMCYGNNSCEGIGQPFTLTTCEDCRNAGNGMNNAWRCDPIIP